MVNELGLDYIGNKWESEGINFLIENYKKMSKQELAQVLNRTEGSIGAMAYKLRLRRYEKIQ